MDVIVEKTLFANGIFRSRDSNQLRCLICATNANFVDWKKHIEEPMHMVTLQHFKLAFSLSSDRIECKRCETNVHWTTFGAHAKLHKIVPWYVPLNRYKTFYENHILQWDKQFYCYPCDIFFPEWSTAFAHTDNERHKNLVKMEVPSNDLSAWNNGDIPYELLVKEGFVTWGTTTFKCTICNRPKIDLKNVFQHVSTDQHGHLKIRFIRELRGWKNSKENNSISDVSVQVPTLPYMYVIKNSTSLYNCEICNMELIDPVSVDNHITGIAHANAMEKYGCEYIFVKDKDYHCGWCDCPILGMANVFLHIKGTRHKNNLSIVGTRKEKGITMNELPVIQESKMNSDNEPDCLPCDYIVMVDSKIFCKICNLTIYGGDHDCHIAGEEHLDSVKQFGKNITMMENYMEYHCKSCNCRILGIDNLFLHLNGNRHAHCTSKVGKQEKVGSNVVEISTMDENEIEVQEIPEVKKSPSKLVVVTLCYDHVLKIDDNYSCCKICDSKIRQSDVDAHVTGNKHDIGVKKFLDSVTLMKNDKYHCKDCNCTIRGINNVYLHIHGKRHRKDTGEYPEGEENPKCVENIANNVELNAKESKPEKRRNTDESLRQTLMDKRNNITQDMIVHGDHVYSGLATVYKNSNGTKNGEIEDNCSKVDNELPVNGVLYNGNTNNVTPKFKSLNLDNGMMSENVDEKKRILPYQTQTQRVMQLLDCHKDYIHDMKDKLNEVELGMKLCLTNDSKNIYCLICCKEVPETLDKYFEHLWTLDHCEYLEEMEKDHDLFELVPGQLSELDLASHYMEEMSEDAIICHVCDKEIDNVTYVLQHHIIEKIHVQRCEKMHARARQNFENIKSRIQCDWYRIYNYRCVPCSANFESELTFVKHVKSTGHESVVKNLENRERGLIYDFCESCGVLWYGNRCTYANHCEMAAHKSLIMRDAETNSIACFEPASMEHIRYAIKYFDEPSVGGQKKKEKKMIRDVENELSIEDKKIIKFFNNCFPLCEKLLPLLEQWLVMCDLSGTERISTYALYWYTIFFLQRESIVPSVVGLKGKIHELPTPSGLKTRGSQSFTQNEAKGNIGIEDFFIRFFTFYANFDFRCDVVSPLIGKEVKKRAFVHPGNLPTEMECYIAYMNNSDDSEMFENDSPMCIQDPFNLGANLTKSVSKVELHRFRVCCTKALTALSTDL